MSSNSKQNGSSAMMKVTQGPLDFDVENLVMRLLQVGQAGGRLTTTVFEKDFLCVCAAVKEVFKQQPPLIEIDPPVEVVGDIHGQYADLLRIFHNTGFPPDRNYMFLGDYVDRGSKNLETITILFCYKILYPEQIFLLRGNHECQNVNKVYGFYEECNRRYKSPRMWQAFQGNEGKLNILNILSVFNWMPLVGIVGARVLCMHGGLSPKLDSLDTLRKIERPIMPASTCLEMDLLWADPDANITGWKANTRGISYTFGPDVVQETCQRLDIDLVARAHQVVQDGYEFFADRKLVTVFSAPHYCGNFDNNAATIHINENLQCTFSVYKPMTHAIRLSLAKIKALQLESSAEKFPKKEATPMGPCDGTSGKD